MHILIRGLRNIMIRYINKKNNAHMYSKQKAKNKKINVHAFEMVIYSIKFCADVFSLVKHLTW